MELQTRTGRVVRETDDAHRALTAIEELRRIDLFEGLQDAELEPWAEVTAIRDAAPGELLLQQGADAPGLLLLFDGTVRDYQRADGRVDPLTPHVGPTWIGAIIAITESEMPVNIETETPCRVAIVPRDAFIELALAARLSTAA